MLVCHTPCDELGLHVSVGDRVLSSDPITQRNAWAFIAESAGSEAASRAAQALIMEGELRATEGARETERQMKERAKRFEPKPVPEIPISRRMLCIQGCGVIGMSDFGGRVFGGDRLLGARVPDGEPMHVA